jgi:hypothetical protein
MIVNLTRLLAAGEIEGADGRLEHRLPTIRKVVEMFDKSIVLLDDAYVQMWFGYRLNNIDIQGKTYYSHRFLLENNAECIIDIPNYQRLYRIRK